MNIGDIRDKLDINPGLSSLLFIFIHNISFVLIYLLKNGLVLFSILLLTSHKVGR